MKPVFVYLEKILIVLSIISLLILFGIQLLTYNNLPIAHTHNASMPFSNNFNSSRKGSIVLKNMTPGYGNVDVLLNGKCIDTFLREDEVSIEVYNNDLIEIDGTRYYEKVSINVVGVSSNIDLPKIDNTVRTSRSIEILSRVILK